MSSPWEQGDTMTVGLTSLIGLGLLVGAALGLRQTADPDTSLVLVNVAAVGLVVALAGNALYLLNGLKKVGELRRVLLQGESAAPVAAATTPAMGLLVATAAMTRYHRDDCPAVQGKPVVPATAGGHEGAGRRPCGLCLEDAL